MARSSVSKAHWEELYRLRKALKQEGFAVDQPFDGYRGSAFGRTGEPRLLFVGKATQGWHWEGAATRSTSEWVMGEVAAKQRDSKRYNSLFWWFLEHMTRQVYEACLLPVGTGRRWAMERIAWTNLMKIGCDGSWPKGDVAKKQRELCIDILKAELGALKPDGVILLTNNFETAVVEAVFGDGNWRKDFGPDGTTWFLPSDGMSVFWTRHPQGWKAESRDQNMAAIAEAVRNGCVLAFES